MSLPDSPPAYRPLPPELAAALAGASDRLGLFASQIHWLPRVTSTNDVAAQRLEHGGREGVVVVADEQTAGRGRLGRAWASPPGAGLYLSTILMPGDAVAPLLTIAAGVAVADGIEAATGLGAQLKWPNDVYVGGRKLAGILAEAQALPAVVLGIGINVMPAAYPPDVAARATSLEGELGRAVDRGLVLAEVLSALAARYNALQQRRGATIVEAWRSRAAAMLGRPVRWTAGGRALTGVAEDIDDTGALLVRTPGGVERVIAGEVTWER